MKSLYYCILFALSLFSPTLAASQNSKIIDAYEKGDYEKCLSLSQRAIQSNSEDLDALLYQAMVWTQWASLKENAAENALQQLSTLRKKDRTRAYINSHIKSYNFVRAFLLEDAHQAAARDEIEVAMQKYMAIMNQLQDRGVHFYVGCSWIKYNSPQLGLKYLKQGLTESYRVFQTTGQKPEEGFLEKLLATTVELAEKGGYRHALSTYGFIDLIYQREGNLQINEHYFRCITLAMQEISADDAQVFGILQEHEKALKNYPNEASIQNLRFVFCDNLIKKFARPYQSNKETLSQTETAFRFILDSLEQKDLSLSQINETLLPHIYQLYPSQNNKDDQAKSLQLYDLFCRINNHYNKKKAATQVFLDYSFSKKNVFEQATALLIYRSKEKKMDAVASKMKALEDKVQERIKNMTDSYTSFDELVYWLAAFPEFEKARAIAQEYLAKHAKLFIANSEFSKAGIFLFRANEYFPSVKEFQSLRKTCVEKDYQQNYVGSYFELEDLAWTGSVENCDPGTISKTAQEKVVQSYDFIRRLSNFPDGTVLRSESNEFCQAAALCMKAQGNLSHKPDESWACYSKAAAQGAGSNSLGLGYAGARCIAEMIEDEGSNNKATGHRGNLLDPRCKSLGYGSTDNSTALSASTRVAHPDSVLKRFDTKFISWPPKGPVPAELVFRRWSFKPYRNAFRMEDIQISMYLDGKALEVDIEHDTPHKVGWVVEGIDRWAKKEQQVKVLIEANVQYDYNAPYEKEVFEYDVIIFPVER